MKKKELYSILMICLLMFSSCLGDTNTRITVGEQEAVYQSRPTKGFYVDGGRFLYGSNLSVTGDRFGSSGVARHGQSGHRAD